MQVKEFFYFRGPGKNTGSNRIFIGDLTSQTRAGAAGRVVEMAGIAVFCQGISGIFLVFFRFFSGISGFFSRFFSVFLGFFCGFLRYFTVFSLVFFQFFTAFLGIFPTFV